MFAGQNVLITGASSGLGAAMARRLARDGARLVLVARRRERLEALAAELRGIGTAAESTTAEGPIEEANGPVRVIVEDLRSEGAAERIVASLGAAGLSVDVLINNAGVGEYGEFAASDVDALEGMMRLNMLGLVRLTRLIVPGMIERTSRAGDEHSPVGNRCHSGILNVASTASFQPTPHMGVYGATKSFVLSFSMSLWHELRRHGICVTCLCPGPIETEFFDRGGFEQRKKAFLRTAMTAEDVAEAGLRALARGRAVCVPGLLNKIGAVGSRLGPLRLATRVSGWLLRPVR